MKKEFVLTKFWQIERDADNYEIVNDWMNKHHNTKGLDSEYNSDFGIVNNKNLNKCCNENLPKITTEQFIKYVLKEEGMEIIGWRLKDDCKQYEESAAAICAPDLKKIYGDICVQSDIDKLKQAGVLQLWFKPVYKEKFKVGDWITVTGNTSGGWLDDTKARTFQITREKTDYFGGEYFGISGKGYKNAGLYADFRLATPEEIKAVQTLKFGGYDVTFKKVTSGIRITCNGETGTFSQLDLIYKFAVEEAKFKFGSIELKSIEYENDTEWTDDMSNTPVNITIGCTTGTWEEFVAIYEKAKSMYE